jgi:tRNA (mo5U34)-methyltransferase
MRGFNIPWRIESNQEQQLYKDLLRLRIEHEPNWWFHKIRIDETLVTPGWSDPLVDKLPYFGLPESLAGMRVLDIGCAEGFFSFEAERRGAAEVVAIDENAGLLERFQLVRGALRMKAQAHLCSVYDLMPKLFGTFDLVMFFGVLYHLLHPMLALTAIRSICKGTLLMQTHVADEPNVPQDVPVATFHPRGLESGPPGARVVDESVFWVPNRLCAKEMIRKAGFTDVEAVTDAPGLPFVVSAQGSDAR